MRAFAVTALLLFAAMIVILSSQHRMRLIVGSYRAVDSLATLAPEQKMSYMVPQSQASTPEFNSVIDELAAFDASHPHVIGDALPVLDQPDTCLRLLEEGRRIHCYNADIGVCSMLAKQKVLARLWDITGPTELGGDGHNLIEVFTGNTPTWKALDPYYHCYFTLRSNADTNAPIGVPALRLALLETPSAVRIVRYVRLPDDRPDSLILLELRFLAPCAMLHANNDFRARFDDRYGLLMPFSQFIDGFSLRASRGVRMFMLGSADRHFIIEDAHSPQYHFLLMKWLFWSMFILFVLFVLLTVFRLSVQSRTKSQIRI